MKEKKGRNAVKIVKLNSKTKKSNTKGGIFSSTDGLVKYDD